MQTRQKSLYQPKGNTPVVYKEIICFDRMELDFSCCEEDLHPFVPGWVTV